MKKKQKLRKKFLIVFILIICLFSYELLFKKSIQEEQVFNDLLSKHNIDKRYYSKTLEYVLLNNIYDEKYLKEYKDIEFNNETNFENVITTFLPKNYTGKEINYLLKLSERNLDILKKLDYQDIKEYYTYNNFDANKIDRYNNYKKLNQTKDIKDIITETNINLDIKAYSSTKEVKDPNDILVLVNKYNYLPSNYKPSDLVYLDGSYNNQVPIRSIVKEDFLKLQESAKKEINIDLMPTTAFRGEGFQKTLYDNYVSLHGVEKADTYSARPSYSEHQTGLAIDLKNMALKDIRLNSDNYKWLENNAYKYGFIIRFPQNKENITLYQFENWHIRYVGKNNAKIIHDNNLTLEEYIDLYINKY